MTTTKIEIQKWESVEIERSLADAQKKDLNNLKIRESIIQRYLAPPPETAYSLEYAYHLLGDVSGQTVLDYGCGAGDNSVLIASHGGRVIGVDISPELIEIARQRMEIHHFENFDFKIGSAHDLPLADESVDVVFGMAILHHLDLTLSAGEVYRVLKPGGRAIFMEPVRNSGLLRTIRKMIPYQGPDVSPYERPLTDAELENFARDFSAYRSRAFSLPFISLVYISGLPDSLLHAAIKIDNLILNSFPFMKHFAAIRVIEMRKDR